MLTINPTEISERYSQIDVQSIVYASMMGGRQPYKGSWFEIGISRLRNRDANVVLAIDLGDTQHQDLQVTDPGAMLLVYQRGNRSVSTSRIVWDEQEKVNTAIIPANQWRKIHIEGYEYWHILVPSQEPS